MFPPFRMSIVIIATIGLGGVCIRIFRKYRINYLYILEFPPDIKLREYQMFKICVATLFIWLICFNLEAFLINYGPEVFGDLSNVSAPSLFSFLLTLFLMFLPVKTLYYKLRLMFLYDIFNVIIAPFGKVKFRQYFMSNILCSWVKPM